MFDIDREGEELEPAWTGIDVAVGEGFWGQDIDEAIEGDVEMLGHVTIGPRIGDATLAVAPLRALDKCQQ